MIGMEFWHAMMFSACNKVSAIRNSFIDESHNSTIEVMVWMVTPDRFFVMIREMAVEDTPVRTVEVTRDDLFSFLQQEGFVGNVWLPRNRV